MNNVYMNKNNIFMENVKLTGKDIDKEVVDEMARKKYSCDFETTTASLSDSFTRLWVWGACEIEMMDNITTGNTIESFLLWCESELFDGYFHNLRFDGEFIVNKLLQMGFKYSSNGEPKTFNGVISQMGQWYQIDICYGYKGRKKLHTVLYDSLKKLPFTVKKIAEDFRLPMKKGDIDYHVIRNEDWVVTQEEYDYLKNDIQIIAQALKIQFEQGLTRMTNGSDALADFKDTIGKKEFERNFPVLNLAIDADIRLAYRGGFTWLNDVYADVDMGEGVVFDVNSLYPSQMKDRMLPVGIPLPFKGRYVKDEMYPLHIQHLRCEFELNENYIPLIQIKGNMLFRANDYLKSSNGHMVDLYLTNIDLEMVLEHYTLYNVEWLDGWKFQQKKGLFDNYIDKWTYVKTHETGAKKQLAKLMLNSLYGKFATNPDVTGKIPYLKKDNSTGYRSKNTYEVIDDNGNSKWVTYTKTVKDENGNLKEIVDDDYKEFREPVYTPMGVFITSWARYTTISTAQSCYDRIIYCDTDSIHLKGLGIPKAIEHIVDDKKLGYWQHEGTFKRARFLRQKTYIEELITDDGLELSVKCAGMPDIIKYISDEENEKRVKEGKEKINRVTWENFHVGFTSTGKLMPKHVDGGVLLMDKDFTIK